MKEYNGYGNIKFYSPDGVLMFHGNNKKLNFYLSKDLVKSYNDGYQLTFTPKGLGYYDRDRSLLNPRINQCVVCGETDLFLLTRHHIVPSIFRRWMPESYKSYSYKFIVLIRQDLHSEYTIIENKYYDDLSIKYNTPLFSQSHKEFYNNVYLKGRPLANTLLKHSHVIPDDRLKEMKEKFLKETGLEPSFKNYKELLQQKRKEERKYYRNYNFNFGKLLMEKVRDYDEFELMWLDHFVSTMKPRFLPEELTNSLKK